MKSLPARSVCELLDIDDRPVVILGMHRSGTSLLARVLERCGVFQGCRLSNNHESLWFQSVDRDLLDLFGCSWAEIGALPPFDRLRDDFSSLVRKTRERVLEELLPQHFGNPVGAGSRRLWGWKDPRTCLTLPLLARIFPRARVAFLRRDPLDVARSLIVRDEKRYDAGFPDAGRMRERFQHYLDLWEGYNERALRGAQLFSPTTATVYEDFVTSPREELARILEGLGIPIPAGLGEIVADVLPDRARRFVADPDPRFPGPHRFGELAGEWYGHR